MNPDHPIPHAHQPRHPKYDAIQSALLTGLLSNVGTKTETHEYLAPRSIRFNVFPGSSLFGQKQKWLMAAELVETTKLYARTCAGVQPQWIEKAADHLVERTYADPRWDGASLSAIVTEKVALHGLVLVAGRTIPYSPIHPRHARELFIHHALVLADFPPGRLQAPFLRHNAHLVEEVQTLEAKIRQRNLLADAATQFAFYDARIPPAVTNGPQFEHWRRRAEAGNPRLLFMDKADLLRSDAPPITAENYPDRVADRTGNLNLPITYRFEPGEVTDGLTLTVPVAALAQLRADRYEWLVPGMLEEKIAALLRELPGNLRRNFVPVPDWAKSATAALQALHTPDSDISLRDSLAAFLAKATGVEITAADFSQAALPPYLRMAFKVMNDAGQVLGRSRDLPQLQRQLAAQTAGSFAAIYQERFTRDRVTAWDFGDLPDSLTVERFGMSITAFPALVDQGNNVHGGTCALRLLPSSHAAIATHRAGVRRLFSIEHHREVKALAVHLPHFTQMALRHFTIGESKILREDLVTLVIDRALFSGGLIPRTKAAYEALKARAAPILNPTGDATVEVVFPLLQNYHDLTLAMDRTPRGSVAVSDIREQLLYLIPSHFLLLTPWEWLQNYPRYLAAMRLRLEKLAAGGSDIFARDLAATGQVAPFWNNYLHRKNRQQEIGLIDPELTTFRWMLEEFRVHLFAQELGVTMPVSARRLEKQWEKTTAVVD